MILLDCLEIFPLALCGSAGFCRVRNISDFDSWYFQYSAASLLWTLPYLYPYVLDLSHRISPRRALSLLCKHLPVGLLRRSSAAWPLVRIAAFGVRLRLIAACRLCRVPFGFHKDKRRCQTCQTVLPASELTFSKIKTSIPIPNLIEVQKNSYERFLQMDLLPKEREDAGLQSVFSSVFPISDFRGLSQLEFVDYSIGNWECKCGNLKGLHHLRTICRNPNCGADNPDRSVPCRATCCATMRNVQQEHRDVLQPLRRPRGACS